MVLSAAISEARLKDYDAASSEFQLLLNATHSIGRWRVVKFGFECPALCFNMLHSPQSTDAAHNPDFRFCTDEGSKKHCSRSLESLEAQVSAASPGYRYGSQCNDIELDRFNRYRLERLQRKRFVNTSSCEHLVQVTSFLWRVSLFQCLRSSLLPCWIFHISRWEIDSGALIFETPSPAETESSKAISTGLKA
jgi:hypothetical protein